MTSSGGRTGTRRCRRCRIGATASSRTRRTSSSSAAATRAITAARELARRGASVTLLEAETLGFGGSTRNGGIVHPGYKWGPRQLVKRYGEETGREPVPRHARRVRPRQAADRRRGDRLRVPRVRLPRPRLRAVARRRPRRGRPDAGRRSASRRRSCPQERLREEIGSDVVPRRPRRAAGGLLHPGKYFAGLADAAARAGADLHEGVRAGTIRRQADGRMVVETDRGAILAKDVVVGTNGYTDGLVPVAPPPDHPDRQLHHRDRATPRGAGTRSSRRRAGRSSTRRTSSTTGTSRPTAGWSSAAGPASCRPRSTGRRAILHKGMLEVHPQLAGLPRRLRVGRQRRLHVRPDAARRDGWTA